MRRRKETGDAKSQFTSAVNRREISNLTILNLALLVALLHALMYVLLLLCRGVDGVRMIKMYWQLIKSTGKRLSIICKHLR